MLFPPRHRAAARAFSEPDDDVEVLRERLVRLVEQHPLIETRPSLDALRGARAPQPRAVFVGVGLVTDSGPSRALPVDVLGLLFAAESVRRTLAAESLVVLIADTHATSWGIPVTHVKPLADAYARLLAGVAEACGLRRMRIVRASELEHDPRYRRTLREVLGVAPEDTHPYVTREVADIQHMANCHGAIVKVGWALQSARQGAHGDERRFDECFQRWGDGAAWFVYAKAGRALDDRRRKAPPYVESDIRRRICLVQREDVRTKLQGARAHVSVGTWRGVRNHLSAICRSYEKLVRPLEGPLEARLQAMIDDVMAGSNGPSMWPGPCPSR